MTGSGAKAVITQCEEGGIMIPYNDADGKSAGTNNLRDKFNFIVQVAANPDYRNKRRTPELTLFDLAVLTRLTERFNVKWGYSATGLRTVASELSATPSGVHKSIQKLIRLGHLIMVEPATKRRAGRYKPSFSVHGHSSEHSVDGYSSEQSVDCYSSEHSVNGYGRRHNGTNRTERKVSEVGGAKRARPKRAHASAASKKESMVSEVDKLLGYGDSK